ncbi:hypothetical protein [Streptomyces sp. NPDC057909]|uniref:hypothetical protein n=1 Tax=Streptomyces sp. NPDC057909 TaxID=3346277 RepID=UPI0036F02056
MSVLRKALALAGTSAAVATLLALPTGSASAASGPSSLVTLSGSFSVVDDDSTIFGSSYEYASSSFRQYLGTGPTHPYEYGADIKSACAGGEVYGTVSAKVTRSQHEDGSVYVKFYGRLFEGSSCSTDDIDGTYFTQGIGINLTPGQAKSGSFKVPMQFESGQDSVTVYYNIKNDVH